MTTTLESIGPHDRLQPFTRVEVGMKKGRVISCKEVDASNGGKIILHHILITHKAERRFGKSVWTPLVKPIFIQPNYSFIRFTPNR